MRLGWMEILLILAVVLIFFGPKRLPGLGNALGNAIRGFKRGIGGQDDKGEPAEPSNCPSCKAPLPQALAAGQRCTNCGYVAEPSKLTS